MKEALLWKSWERSINMIREQILPGLKKIFKDALGEKANVENITGKERLVQDLGFDSISIVYMAFTIEKEFHVDMTKTSFKSFKTVDDVINYILKKSNI